MATYQGRSGEGGIPMRTTTTTSQAVEAVLTGLKGYRFLNLSTFRKSSVPVLTTVLFALASDKIYVWTPKDSGKVKRIRNDATRCRSRQALPGVGHSVR